MDKIKILECNYGLYSMFKNDFKELLERFYKKSRVKEGSPDTVSDMFENILRDNINTTWNLHFIIDWEKQKIIGYVMLFTYLSVFFVKRCLIYQLFILTQHSKDTMPLIVKYVEEHGKKLGCSEIELVTNRKLKGYERWIKKFRAHYHYKSAVFTKEI